jgi:hypothetical protein
MTFQDTAAVNEPPRCGSAGLDERTFESLTSVRALNKKKTRCITTNNDIVIGLRFALYFIDIFNWFTSIKQFLILYVFKLLQFAWPCEAICWVLIIGILDPPL